MEPPKPHPRDDTGKRCGAENIVSKRALRDRIERLPPSLRRLFEPLALEVETAGSDTELEEVSLGDLALEPDDAPNEVPRSDDAT